MDKLTLEQMESLAKAKGGKCLSKEYINNRTKLLWQCSKGHQWESTPTIIKSGCWCPYCSGKTRLTLEDMQKWAQAKGGKCLSKEYINSHTKLEWQCSKKHIWQAPPTIIQRGCWCPYCSGKMRLTLEHAQKLAEAKGGKCLSKEYTNNRIKMLWQCSKGHQWEATQNAIQSGRWCLSCRRLTIEEMHTLAKAKGGKCLSKEYKNVKTKLLWQCKQGHQWETRPAKIKEGSWCPRCARKSKFTIENMRELATAKGGKCLSKRYINSKSKLLWQCKENHQWKASSHDIKAGSWCPECSIRRLTIEEMQALAKAKGGKCLSKEYKSVKTKLLWQCKKGHQWEAVPETIKRDGWCPECAYNKKLTLEEIQTLAESKGGKCLSEKYINYLRPLLWQCSKGHQWEASAKYVKHGNVWCPVCKLMQKDDKSEKTGPLSLREKLRQEVVVRLFKKGWSPKILAGFYKVDEKTICDEIKLFYKKKERR